MELRKAKKTDLPVLEIMFKNIVESMQGNGITIWNEFYPYEEFAGDIEDQSLYLITDEEEIVAAFGMYQTVDGRDCFGWKDMGAKALYLGRVGVNTKYLRQGMGKLVLKKASEIAKKENAIFLRLLVSDINMPAINLYRANGFKQVAGTYTEFSEALNKNIVELGFEIEVL